MAFNVKIVKIILTNKNIKQIEQYLDKIRFSTRLPYANKKIRKTICSMVNTKYKATEDMKTKLQSTKGETNLQLF